MKKYLNLKCKNTAGNCFFNHKRHFLKDKLIKKLPNNIKEVTGVNSYKKLFNALVSNGNKSDLLHKKSAPDKYKAMSC